MIRIRLTSVMVDDQAKARRFYTEVLGFTIRHDIPMGAYNWLTVVSPVSDEVELLLEPTAMPAAQAFRKALFEAGTPLTALASDNVEQEYQRLTALGVIFKAPPKDIGSTVIAAFDDTCGNYIQLFQAP